MIMIGNSTQKMSTCVLEGDLDIKGTPKSLSVLGASEGAEVPDSSSGFLVEPFRLDSCFES